MALLPIFPFSHMNLLEPHPAGSPPLHIFSPARHIDLQVVLVGSAKAMGHRQPRGAIPATGPVQEGTAFEEHLKTIKNHHQRKHR